MGQGGWPSFGDPVALFQIEAGEICQPREMQQPGVGDQIRTLLKSRLVRFGNCLREARPALVRAVQYTQSHKFFRLQNDFEIFQMGQGASRGVGDLRAQCQVEACKICQPLQVL